MNEKNYEYLTNQLKHTGFGDTLNEDLRKNMEKQNAEFTLNLAREYGNDRVSATLHFKKSAESDMIFFNKYDFELKKEQETNSIKQSFYINSKGSSITLKEAYNLMNGRSVYKEDLVNKQGEKYNAWVQADLNRKDNNDNYKMNSYHQNYGYDLLHALEKHPVKELNDQDAKEKLIRSLEKGNIQFVSFEVNGKIDKMFIEANPQFKSINVYDAAMKPVQGKSVRQEEKHAGVPEQKQESKKNETKETSKTISESKDNKKEIKQAPQDGLLHKKRTNHKKGLAM